MALAVDVAGQNHARAAYNMALAGMVIALLLAFVCVLNWTIWKVRAWWGGERVAYLRSARAGVWAGCEAGWCRAPVPQPRAPASSAAACA